MYEREYAGDSIEEEIDIPSKVPPDAIKEGFLTAERLRSDDLNQPSLVPVWSTPKIARFYHWSRETMNEDVNRLPKERSSSSGLIKAPDLICHIVPSAFPLGRHTEHLFRDFVGATAKRRSKGEKIWRTI